ncbi:MAG: alpha/beta hydrolase [Dehalococcoidia bacterium]|nr:alpha/beta hydrolase [Dehalococcoidia bacterium]
MIEWRLKEDGTMLLFIHGAGGGAELWRYQTDYFPESVAVDLPGHPRGQGLQSIEDYANWVRGYVYERGLAPVTLVGHSMGGGIAQWLAVNHPDMVRSLVLVSTGARLKVAPQIFQVLEGDYDQAVDFMLGNSFGPESAPELLEEVKRLRLRVPVEVVRGDFQACDRFDLMDRIADIAAPTCIICGTADKMTPLKYGQFLLSRIPGSRLEEIPGAGHNVMLEKPAEFNAALERFLKDLEKR